MSVLLDTNIILRLAQPEHEMHDSAREAVQRLNDHGASLCIVPQVIYEYWVVATRPVENNGLGMSVKDAETSVSSLTRDLPLLGDERAVFANWQMLVSKYDVKGKVAKILKCQKAVCVFAPWSGGKNKTQRHRGHGVCIPVFSL